jgi:hypothetical protein
MAKHNLPCLAVTLISYPVANRMLSASVKLERAQLPTPYQLSFLAKILSGKSFSALWGG